MIFRTPEKSKRARPILQKLIDQISSKKKLHYKKHHIEIRKCNEFDVAWLKTDQSNWTMWEMEWNPVDL